MKTAVPLALLLVMTAPAFGQATQAPVDRPQQPTRRDTGRIVGTVHMPPGQHHPPRMMSVTLSTLGGNYLMRVNLNDERSFIFSNVRSGNYIITVESVGHESSEVSVEVTNYMFGEETFVTVPLGRPLRDGKKTEAGEGQMTVAARSLVVPEAARKELERALREAEKNNPEKAIRHLERALDIEPELHQAYNNLAVQYTLLGRKAEAVEALNRSIEINPHDATTYRNLAQLHLGERAYSEALESLRKSLELHPRNGRTHLLLGEVYLGLGVYQLALKHFEDAERETPPSRSPLGLGQCYLQLGRYQEALKEFQSFLAEEPSGHRAEAVRQLVTQLEQRLGTP